ncbi:hypothetical protein [Pelosinus baikalensis]|uniref:Uncharacterized protein n=1 Tax=Pelosinus baikalensis TaxID=2892015 RepID=A0ABS8HQS5_9FIRM|nr:hypothetical protein [Pelosinus baikalensis]MCC5465532.1 hypothetical protein [Pelosinus baikalensis]
MYHLHYDKETGLIIEAPYHSGVHKVIPIPNIEITDVEHDDWMQNQTTRKVDIATKKLIECEAKVTELTNVEKIFALDAEYQPQFAELSSALGMATLADNTDLITRIKADYTALKAEYDTKRGEIIGS